MECIGKIFFSFSFACQGLNAISSFLQAHYNMLNLPVPYTPPPSSHGKSASRYLGPTKPKPATQKGEREMHINTFPNLPLCHIRTHHLMGVFVR